ncbi:hypothetical protein H6F67_01395 [Microcoleus sp. FACHB-1515]|uniref:hypothetical protein n=1 Tax=Cyanophyceae TaxID=3028117 RepID=UPI001687D362|nr:hypothetical protein [Microcoleus sp. FACHB-1515]MBD2088524.1 hypothetical protein [Microcoleus sp. FACHB-1515]
MPYSPLRLWPIACATLLASLPIAPAQASIDFGILGRDSEYRAREADYFSCATNLLSTGISEAEAAAACSAALAPRQIGDCAIDLYNNTELQPEAIVAGCRQVRRPLELADCVVDVRAATTDTAETDILDSCRRSLLPRRYGNCVVGLARSTATTGIGALSSCIQAGDRPRNLRPSFVPSSQPIPTTPRSNVSTEGADAESQGIPLR